MDDIWSTIVLSLIVAMISIAQRQAALQQLFKWLPLPLWCYALPIGAVAIGWLPSDTTIYRALTDALLPPALALLLMSTHLQHMARTGWRALLIMAIGTVGITLGAPIGVWLLHAHVPAEAWKGAGALAGTWTGGTMNLLSLRTILDVPDAVFAPLIVVDAMVAYGWMALLVAASAHQIVLNRWLRATAETRTPNAEPTVDVPFGQGGWRAYLIGVLIAIVLSVASRGLAHYLPATRLVSSASGWTVLLVTTAALACSLVPAARRLHHVGMTLGYPCLYIVLAATGAQARMDAFEAAPAWLLIGLVTVCLHGSLVMIAGRAFHLPLALLATASQANVGGVVSAPLVGAVYHHSLAPVGLVLAMVGNALGSYLGCLAAWIGRWLVSG